MKYRIFLSFFIVMAFMGNSLSAQIVGGDAFLQGAYLEIGLDFKGAFGTCTSPAGYHPHGVGAALGEVYDYGHDGWTVAAIPGYPEYMGDYTEPGYPFEGWSIEVGGVEYRNWVDAGLCGGSFFVPGSITGYTNAGGTITGTFTGNIAGIHIVAESRIDTLASAVVTTVRFYNTTAAPITDIYYGRTCDPDNVSTWGGSGSETHNRIVHQNEDGRHDVLVSSVADYGPTYPYPYDLITYMGIGTKDCRAVCTYFGDTVNQYGLTPSYTPAQMWSMTTTPEDYSYVQNDSNFADIGFALSYKIGTLAAWGTPGDSAIISFAYIFNTNSGLDSAFPEPLLIVNGNPIQPLGIAPTPTFDTFNVCDNPGVINIPVSIKNATDKCWSWSTWTWAPATGLSTTAGVTNTINTAALSGITTYTVIGTDSAVNMLSCNHRVMFITILPCLTASSNAEGPFPGGICLYDTLLLYAHGDSTDATYVWFGPGGFSASSQYAISVAPHTLADTGWYYVVKTVGGAHDTTRTFVRFNVTPVVTAGSNSPVCSQNTLSLSATPDSASETFFWTGPNGFISGLQNPTIASVPVKDSGIYKVKTVLHGCIDSGYVHVHIDSTPEVPYVSNNTPGPPGISHCPDDTLNLYASDSTPNITYFWAGPISFTSTDQNPEIMHAMPSASGEYTVTVTTIGTVCKASAITSVSITPTPPLVATNNGPLCTGIKDTLLLQATSLPGATYVWTGPYTFYSLNQNPFRTPVIAEYAGIYQVQAMANGCPSAIVNDTFVVRPTPDPPRVPWLTYCQFFDAPQLQAMGDSILWYATVSPPSVGSLTAPIPSTADVGVTWYYVSQTLNSCESAIDSARINIVPGTTVTVTPDLTVCPHDSAILTAVASDPQAYYHWSPYIFLSDTSGPSVVTRPEKNVHYTVIASNKFGCGDTAHVFVTVQSGAVLNLGDSVTLFPGESYQISPQTNCVTFAWFPPAGLDNPTFANPVATPQISTRYIVHAMTSWGCKIVDSLDIIIDPETSIAMPNAFTPGGSVNNEFKIIKRGLAELKYFRIWDRWGVKVFETKDIDKGWDGQFNGKPQPFGVYVYEIGAVTSTGKDFVKHGNVTLVR